MPPVASAGLAPTIMSADTTHRFLRSTGAAVFSQAWRVGVTLGVMLLCRRLVPAEEYGFWNWAVPVFLILGAVRDLGLVYHVIRVEPRPYGNLLALELGWGTILALSAVVGAPWLVSVALADPIAQAVPAVRWLGLFLFLEGLSSVPRVWFEGELEVGRTVVPELIRNFAMATVTVGLVLLGAGVWGLVAGQIAGSAVYAAALWRRAWGRIPLHYARGEMWPLVRDSLPLATIWLVAILSRHVDTIIIGKRFSATEIGNYGIAYKNAFRMSEIVIPALTRSLYPALVAFARDARRLFDTYAMTTVMMMAVEAPVAVFLFVNADVAVWLLGGAQYTELAPPYLRVLAFAPLVDPFSRLGGEVIKARHQDRIWVASAVVTLISFVLFGVLLTGTMGPAGMAWAKLLPAGGLLMAWALYRVAPSGFRRLARDLAIAYAIPLPFFVGLLWLPSEAAWLRFFLSLASLGASLAVAWWRFGPRFLAYARAAKDERDRVIAGEPSSTP